MYYVYILRNTFNYKLYKGYTEDLRKRISEHNRNKVRSTKYKGKLILIYYEAFINKSDALREEKFLKTGKGRERLKFLLENAMKK